MFFGAASCALVQVGLGLSSHECVRLGTRITHSTAIHLAMDFITPSVDGFTQETFLALVTPTAESPLLFVPLLETSHMVQFLAIQIICCRWFLGAASNVSLMNKTRRGRGVGYTLAHEWRMGCEKNIDRARAAYSYVYISVAPLAVAG
jgi:hypothetical protein